MRILITAYELDSFFGGVQTFCHTVKAQMESLGHTVDLWAVSGKNHRTLGSNYDLAIVNSNVALVRLKGLRCKKIFISHGVLPKLEQPVKGADVYLSVSEEVQANLLKKGFASEIIRNPIDLQKFKYVGCGDELKNITFLDRRYVNPFIGELKNLGYTCKTVGRPKPTPNIFEALEDADLVVGRGRGIYEAMAMGKNVIISGNNSGRSKKQMMDGFVDEYNFYDYRKNNCSGRCLAITPDFDRFMLEIARYSPAQGKINRELIEKNNDVRLICEQILKLCTREKRVFG